VLHVRYDITLLRVMRYTDCWRRSTVEFVLGGDSMLTTSSYSGWGCSLLIRSRLWHVVIRLSEHLLSSASTASPPGRRVSVRRRRRSAATNPRRHLSGYLTGIPTHLASNKSISSRRCNFWSPIEKRIHDSNTEMLPISHNVMHLFAIRLIGSRQSYQYFRSVCWFVCLSVCLCVCLFVCAEFFSAVFDPISIKLGHMLYVSV